MKRSHLFTLICALLFLSLSCRLVNLGSDDNGEEPTEAPPAQETAPPAAPPPTTEGKPTPEVEGPPPTEPAAPPPQKPGSLIQPGDLEYLGAFRLPDGPEEINFVYSGQAMAYYPDGDPSGPDDGFPGSIFATGHDWNQYVAEIDIPVPVISTARMPSDLNSATLLQDFQNIRGDLYNHLDFELPRAGLAYLPPQGAQTSGKLYFCWHQHMGEGDVYPTHGWSELDLSNPQAAGPWRIGDYWNYVTCDYIFDIPQSWADANTPGMRLATGRFRDGGQGTMGPSLFAIGPWNQGNPPPRGETIPAIPLLMYSSVYTEEGHTLNNYHHSDEWPGAAWMTAGDKAAVIFIGTKGMGDNWYGCADGTVWPDEPPYPPECPERGWWSTSFEHQIIFYNPADLAAAARGEIELWQPQPYAVLNIDSYLFKTGPHEIFYDIGAASFDRQRGLLYVIEPLVDEDKSIIHVWRVNP